MLDLYFNCPECDQNLVVSAKGAGTSISCPKCQHRVQVPYPDDAGVVTRDSDDAAPPAETGDTLESVDRGLRGESHDAELKRLASAAHPGISVDYSQFERRGMLAFGCPVCSRPMWVKSRVAGGDLKCEGCGSQVKAPSPQTGQPATVVQDNLGALPRRRTVLPPAKHTPSPVVGKAAAREETAHEKQSQLPSRKSAAPATNLAPATSLPTPRDETESSEPGPEAMAGSEAAETPAAERAGGAHRVRPDLMPRLIPKEEMEIGEEWGQPADDALRLPQKPLTRWMLGMGIILVAVVIGAVIWNAGNEDGQKVAGDGIGDGQIPEILKEGTEARTFLVDFFEAVGWEKKAKFVRRAEVTAPMMREYYAKRPGMSAYAVEFGHTSKEKLEGLSCYVILFRKAGQQDDIPPIQAIFEKSPEGLKLDWESLVGYSEMPMKEVLKKRPETPVLMRVIADPYNYYIYDFDKPDKYLCMRLYDSENEAFCFGYLLRESDDAKALEKRIEELSDKGISRMLLTLKVRFLPYYEGKSEVEITEIVRHSWFVP